MTARNWEREELLLALNLYFKTPFGQYHHRNPEVIHLASLINRTPSAVAMKLSNFTSLDPYYQDRGIKGLVNASKADKAIWDEFTGNWNRLALESEFALARFTDTDQLQEVEESEIPQQDWHDWTGDFSGATEQEREVKIRLGQSFFRKMILANYRESCCICEMPIRALLVASHIIPWRDDETLRLNPHNGLCLCVLHDKGFDRGLLAVDADYQIRVSPIVSQYSSNDSVVTGLIAYDRQEITLPDKFLPEESFLQIHQEKYFIRE